MIAIGCDHAGFQLKNEIIAHLKERNIDVADCGCDGSPCDYPVVAESVCSMVKDGSCEKGILICGTGIGMSIAANKFRGIRAALCTEHFSAKYTRLHNNSNVLCMGARTLGAGIAIEITDIFLSTEFEGGRHQRRIDLITDIENNQQKTEV